ncbi:uncharacterized protein LOC115894950 [Rhinopithecus roxellana]|uniref:uncharacterized protein LOC115894950 n=1 Tax=Rhinopithecus roxellana TaxID=61622 RepID=UPI0012372121|nr:uncharacterized protein LOC115894950 [Rhinopithecus roxellana]
MINYTSSATAIYRQLLHGPISTRRIKTNTQAQKTTPKQGEKTECNGYAFAKVSILPAETLHCTYFEEEKRRLRRERSHVSCTAGETGTPRGDAAAAAGSAGVWSPGRELGAPALGAARRGWTPGAGGAAERGVQFAKCPLSKAFGDHSLRLEPKAGQTSSPDLPFCGWERKAGEPPGIIPLSPHRETDAERARERKKKKIAERGRPSDRRHRAAPATEGNLLGETRRQGPRI